MDSLRKVPELLLIWYLKGKFLIVIPLELYTLLHHLLQRFRNLRKMRDKPPNKFYCAHKWLHRFLNMGHGNLIYSISSLLTNWDSLLSDDVSQQFPFKNSNMFFLGLEIYHIFYNGQKYVSSESHGLLFSWKKQLHHPSTLLHSGHLNLWMQCPWPFEM